MRDNLKKHVANQQEEFELYPFDVDQGWKDLNQKLKPERRPLISSWMYVAASVVVLLVAALGVLRIGNTQQYGMPQEVAEAQLYYEHIIDAKLYQVKSRINDQELLADLDELDLAFKELKQDLKDDAQNEEVILAMIENYRLKLSILEKMLFELEEESHEEEINL